MLESGLLHASFRAAMAQQHRDATPHVALLTLELFVPHAASLKAKRRVVKGLKDRLRARFNASVAEIGYLDHWQRALIGLTFLGTDRRALERDCQAVEDLAREACGGELVGLALTWL